MCLLVTIYDLRSTMVKGVKAVAELSLSLLIACSSASESTDRTGEEGELTNDGSTNGVNKPGSPVEDSDCADRLNRRDWSLESKPFPELRRFDGGIGKASGGLFAFGIHQDRLLLTEVSSKGEFGEFKTYELAEPEFSPAFGLRGLDDRILIAGFNRNGKPTPNGAIARLDPSSAKVEWAQSQSTESRLFLVTGVGPSSDGEVIVSGYRGVWTQVSNMVGVVEKWVFGQGVVWSSWDLHDKGVWPFGHVSEIAVGKNGQIWVVGSRLRSFDGQLAWEPLVVQILKDGQIGWVTQLDASWRGKATSMYVDDKEDSVWIGGLSIVAGESPQARIWSVDANQGSIRKVLDVTTPKMNRLEQPSAANFGDLVVNKQGVYFSWIKSHQVGEDATGVSSEVCLVSQSGELVWSTSSRTLHQISVDNLVEDGGTGVYAFGYKWVDKDSTVGYIARFCPPTYIK